METRVAVGPERILPEWWFDDPAWRSGPRDYWRVEVQGGGRLWLFYAHGAEVSGGWFCPWPFRLTRAVSGRRRRGGMVFLSPAQDLRPRGHLASPRRPCPRAGGGRRLPPAGVFEEKQA